MSDETEVAALLKKIGDDAQSVLEEFYEPVAAATERTSRSAVATALVRILAALVINDTRSDEQVARDFATGLLSEMEFVRRTMAARETAGQLLANGAGQPRERREVRPQRRRSP